MTNEEFNAFVQNNFRTARGSAPSISAAAAALGLHRDTVGAMMTGHTRKGGPAPVPKFVDLACQAWTAGMRPR